MGYRGPARAPLCKRQEIAALSRNADVRKIRKKVFL
jgi:hypothetical protein